jgi:hypothetical protein
MSVQQESVTPLPVKLPSISRMPQLDSPALKHHKFSESKKVLGTPLMTEETPVANPRHKSYDSTRLEVNFSELAANPSPSKF